MDDEELNSVPDEEEQTGGPAPEETTGIYDNEDPARGRAFQAGQAVGKLRKRRRGAQAEAKNQLLAGEQGEASPASATSMFPMEQEWFKGIDQARGFGGTTKVIAKGLMSRRGALGLGVGGGIGAVLIALFFALLPLKINMIMENLQNKYFSGNDSAVEKRMDSMFNQYVKQKLLPALAKPGCTSTKTMDKNCVAVSPGDTPFDRLANAWRDARLENRMADKYGIELSKSPGSSTFTIRIDDKTAPDIDIEGFRKNPSANLWQAEGFDRTQTRRLVKEALEGETKYKKMYYRIKVGQLLERKYGIRRCLFYCEKRDMFRDNLDAKKNALKMAVANRVLGTRSDTLGLAMSCIIDSECLNDAEKPNRDGNKPTDLERKTTLQKNLQKYLDEKGTKLTSESLEKLVTQVDDITEAGSLGKYAATKIAEKIGETVGKEAGKEAATQVVDKAIPVIGWINTAATMIDKAAKIGPALKKFSYVLSATAAVSYFTTYRTYADEQKGGYTDPEIAKSMAEGLGDTVGDAEHKGQTAEASPMYGALFGSSSTTQTAFSKLFPSAYAASPTYTCDDGNPLPAGQLACPEESFVTSNIVTDISDAFNTPGLAQLRSAAGIWTNTIGKLASLPGDIVSKATSYIPFMDQLQAKIGEWSGELVNNIGKRVFKSAVSDVMSGGRSFQVLAAGADAAAATGGEFGIGGRKLSQIESDKLLAEQEAEQQDEFDSKPFYARMFDTESPQSLVGQVAMAMPVNTSTATNQFATSLIRNPFALIADSFASLFTRRAKAATSLPNPFGTLRFGYPVDDPALNTDPSTLTKEYCQNFNKQWADDTTTDPDTGMPVHETVNPCLLDSSVMNAGGGYFSDDALSEDFSSVGPAEGQETGGEISTGPLNTSIPVAGNTYDTSKCEAGTDVSPPGGADGYAGGKLYKIRICKVQGIVVNAVVSKQVDAMINAARAAGLNLTGGGFRTMQGQIDARKRNGCKDIMNTPSSSCGTPTARPGYSNHQMGFAIDFERCNTRGTACYIWLNANAAKFGFKNFPKEAWHWSPDGK